MATERAKLTEIARALVETFPSDFATSSIPSQVESYRKQYESTGGAECIRIGHIDYIVINDDYRDRDEDDDDVPTMVSPLFYNSIHDPYAIIDAKTSATLIDEVYSRISYMQRVCDTQSVPDLDTVKRSVRGTVGEGETIKDVSLENLGTDSGVNSLGGRANIFQCYMVKDTGVSALPETYSFMLKNGVIKEIPPRVMNRIRRIGKVKLLKDSSELEENSDTIRTAIFRRSANDDMDIQSVTVKSIFEIRMDVMGVHLRLKDAYDREGMYNTSYIAGTHDEFAELNATIHACNCCGHDIMDVKDASKIYHLHVNSDAIDPNYTTDSATVYAVGCEDCLEQCPVCGGWHFNYQKFVNTAIYDKVTLKAGRAFIKGLRNVDVNYCTCREGIEWVYDDRSGDEGAERGVIPITKMAFVNFANEKIGSYDDYIKYYTRNRRGARIKDAMDECNFAKRTLSNYKRYLARRYDMDDYNDVQVTNVDKCGVCISCGGEYYGAQSIDTDFTCDACQEMRAEKRRSVTRLDGVVFMRGPKGTISKYVVTKLGNLRKLGATKKGKKRSPEELLRAIEDDDIVGEQIDE